MWVPPATRCMDQDQEQVSRGVSAASQAQGCCFREGCLWGGGPQSMGVCFVPLLREREERAPCAGKGREEEEMKTN